MATKAAPRDDKEQSKRFIEMARELALEADGDDSKTDLLMGRLAKMKPEPRTKKPKVKVT